MLEELVRRLDRTERHIVRGVDPVHLGDAVVVAELAMVVGAQPYVAEPRATDDAIAHALVGREEFAIVGLVALRDRAGPRYEANQDAA